MTRRRLASAHARGQPPTARRLRPRGAPGRGPRRALHAGSGSAARRAHVPRGGRAVRPRRGRYASSRRRRRSRSSTWPVRCAAPASTGCATASASRTPCGARAARARARTSTRSTSRRRSPTASRSSCPAAARPVRRRSARERAPAAAGGPPQAPVSLNSATAEQLDTLDGVGPATAQKILEYRRQHGGFRSVDDLGQIPGIGPKRLAALRGQGAAVSGAGAPGATRASACGARRSAGASPRASPEELRSRPWHAALRRSSPACWLGRARPWPCRSPRSRRRRSARAAVRPRARRRRRAPARWLAQARLAAHRPTRLAPRSGTPCTCASCSSRRRARASFGGRMATVRPRRGAGAAARRAWRAAGRRARRRGPRRPRRPRALCRCRRLAARARRARPAACRRVDPTPARRRGGVAGALDGVAGARRRRCARASRRPRRALLRGMVLGGRRRPARPHARRLPGRRARAPRRAPRPERDAARRLVLGVASVLGLALRMRLGARAGGHRAVRAARRRRAVDPARGRHGRRGGGRGRWPGGPPRAGTRCCSRRPSRWRSIRARSQDAGWQLSFAAVVAILAAGRPRRATAWRGAGLPRGLAEATALTVAATLGTAPLIAAHFGQPSLVSLPANVLAAPAVAPVDVARRCSRRRWGSSARRWRRRSCARAASRSRTSMWVAHVAAACRGAPASAPAGVVGAVCAAAALAVVVPRARPPVAAAVLVAWRSSSSSGARPLALAAGRSPPAGGSSPLASRAVGRRARGARRACASPFLDVGQGDATLIQGGAARCSSTPGRPTGPILTRLRHAGVRRLDVLVVTHAQADHDGGAAAVLGALPVAPGPRRPRRRPRAQRRAHGCAGRAPRVSGWSAARAGEVLRVGAIALRVLWPAGARGPADAGEDPNHRAIVAEADAGGVRTLLTADAESDVLAGLDLGPVDVLKVSHHGSADPGLPGAAGAPAPAGRGDRGRAPQHLRPPRAVDGPRAARRGRRGRAAPTATAA